MSTPVVEREDSARQVKVSEFSNYFDIQSGGINMAWPNFAMYAGSPNHVMTDLRRIQGMQYTIEYLRELLSKEFTNNIKEKTMMEKMKKELEASNEKNKLLQEQLQATQISIKETQTGKKQVDIAHQEVEDATLILPTDFTALKAQNKLLKDKLIAEKKKNFSSQFNELGKKYLYMIEYSGEQTYNDYLDKHMEFMCKLESLNISTNKTQGPKIKQMLACLKEQVKLLEEFREEFRVTIELLVCRLDQECASVSDLSIRAQKPVFKIPLEDFDPLFQAIANCYCGHCFVELDCEQKV